MAGTDWDAGELYAALVRFGMWEEILAEPSQTRLIRLTGTSIGDCIRRQSPLPAFSLAPCYCRSTTGTAA